MKKILFLSLISILSYNQLLSQISLTVNKEKSVTSNQELTDQKIPAYRNCGTMDLFEKQLRSDSVFSQQMRILENQTQNQIKQITQTIEEGKLSTVYKIPVVVHVVYNNSVQNITDAQIYSQISALNRDFRKQNADINQIPSVFSGIAADVGIEFCMATVDPFGNATNGITRTQTNNSNGFSNLTDDVKSNSTGGKSPWNPLSYLNIWVCNLQGTLLGYAQFPGGTVATDGVVIDYAYFGTTGTATSPFDLGRTATHEVGHYLNLRHIWGDNNCGDDFVGDTPTQQTSNSQCPTFPHITCGNGPSGDMFMNYMDYVDDNCMHLFTNGQKARMIATITNSRSGLLNNNNYNCTLPTALSTCDTLPNYSSGSLLTIYRLSDIGQQGDGYIAGTNSFGDIGFAEKFTAPQPLEKINSVMIAFARAYGVTNSSFNVKVWKADSGPLGYPGTVLASVPLTLGQIAPDISSGNYTVVTFNNPISVSTAYYVGIEFDNSQIDSIALYTTIDGQVTTGKAFEKYDTGVWYPFTDPINSWGINVALAVAPIVCIDYTGISETKKQEDSRILVFPNPAKEKIEIQFDFSSKTPVTFQLFDMTGKSVKRGSLSMTAVNAIAIDLGDLKSGLYSLRCETDTGVFTKKISVVE